MLVVHEDGRCGFIAGDHYSGDSRVWYLNVPGLPFKHAVFGYDTECPALPKGWSLAVAIPAAWQDQPDVEYGKRFPGGGVDKVGVLPRDWVDADKVSALLGDMAGSGVTLVYRELPPWQEVVSDV